MTTPLLTITPLYGAVLAFFLIQLAANVIKLRKANGVPLLDGGIDDLARAIRAHGNFTEYVPLTLILMGFAELNAANGTFLHILGVVMVIARLFHVISIHKKSLKLRVFAMSSTFFALAASAVLGIVTIFS